MYCYQPFCSRTKKSRKKLASSLQVQQKSILSPPFALKGSLTPDPCLPLSKALKDCSISRLQDSFSDFNCDDQTISQSLKRTKEKRKGRDPYPDSDKGKANHIAIFNPITSDKLPRTPRVVQDLPNSPRIDPQTPRNSKTLTKSKTKEDSIIPSRRVSVLSVQKQCGESAKWIKTTSAVEEVAVYRTPRAAFVRQACPKVKNHFIPTNEIRKDLSESCNDTEPERPGESDNLEGDSTPILSPFSVPSPAAMDGRPVVATKLAGLPSPVYCSNIGSLGRISPGHDLGYHTLVSRQTPTPTPPRERRATTPSPWSEIRASPFPGRDLTSLSSCPRSSPRPQLPQIPSQQQSQCPSRTGTIETTEQLLATFKGKRISKTSLFDKLSDELIVKVFSFLPTNALCQCARVCRKWYHLAWDPRLWNVVTLTGETINADRALKQITRLLARESEGCVHVEKVVLNGCVKLTDKGLSLIGRRCPELRHLEVKGCLNLTNIGLFEMVSQCLSLEHLDVTGCHLITCINLSQQSAIEEEPMHSRQLYLQYLDMTDCYDLQDVGLKVIVRNCPQLLHLYLRRCVNITDLGVKYIASYCLMLREVSVSDCVQVTDFGMYELAKLGPNLRYLSVAKCDQISDAGIKQIARHCYKLRYLNVRGCEAVSDDSMEMVARSCPRLRALDIGKCDVTDNGMKLISENCPNLKKLSAKSCDMITDLGIQYISYYCRGLQQLNIQDCQVTLEGYRTVKKYCRRCIIEHTNPGFF